jgi:nitronate monooxygenase
MDPRRLESPIVLAPMAGGPSTPALAAAVAAAGGFGFLAGGYRTTDTLGDDIAALRALSRRPFGVNVFVPGAGPADRAPIAAYAQRLAPDARRLGAETGLPRFEDDHWAAKLDLLAEVRPAVASFTFGCPSAADVARLHEAGVGVWITITSAAEARAASAVGADALVAQGIEAGGHHGSFADDDDGGLGVLALLRLAGAAVDVPLIAAGGIADGAGIAAVLRAGAAAAQLGTAFLLAPEAGTPAVLRAALSARPAEPTRLTRAFTGRLARGIVNRFMLDHDAHAPRGYPEVHHLTAPLRAASRGRGEGDAVNLWAGQAYELARALPAGELVATLRAEIHMSG